MQRKGESENHGNSGERGVCSEEKIARFMVDFSQEEDPRFVQHRRERNRIAARKSREKKARYLHSLKEEAESLVTANEALEKSTSLLAEAIMDIAVEMDRVVVGNGTNFRRVVQLLVSCSHLLPKSKKLAGPLSRFSAFLSGCGDEEAPQQPSSNIGPDDSS